MMEILKLLTDWNKLAKVTSTLAQSWTTGLGDLTELELRQGMGRVRDHVGFFDIGVFRGLCLEREVKRPPDWSQTLSLSNMGSFGKSERFKELAKVTQAMAAEKGVGPITKATRAGVLTADYVRGLSAMDIIEKVCRADSP